jgi:hypothetical protein
MKYIKYTEKLFFMEESFRILLFFLFGDAGNLTLITCVSS